MNDKIQLKSVYYQVSLTRSECRRRGGSKRKPRGAVEPGREEVGTDSDQNQSHQQHYDISLIDINKVKTKV